MSTRFGHALGIGGARAVVGTLGTVLLAGIGLAAALGGKAGAPAWLRIVLGAVALLVAVVVVMLTFAEQTATTRARTRRIRAWAEDHFAPRGRGVSRKSETGAYFTGRTRVLRELMAWLDSDRGGLCVVTGDPGSGKSAVLGRLVALSRDGLRRELTLASAQAGTEAPPAPKANIDVAVWGKGLTMIDVAESIAAAIGVSAASPDEMIQAAIQRGRRLVVLVDALDEASGEGEARRIAQRLLKPLAAAGRSSGVKVLVGTRRGPGNELLDALGGDAQLLDLDTPDYLEVADLVEYVRRRLVREGEPAAHTPYRSQPEVAAGVAHAVAARAAPSFLVAQLVSGALADAAGVVDTGQPSWENQFADDVGSAMDDYLDCFETESDRRRARDLLSALAYAEGAGLPRETDGLWPQLAGALAGKAYGGRDIEWLLDTAAADLVDCTIVDGTATCRLFHQGLSDHLRGRAERQIQCQRALARALEATVPERPDHLGRDWSRADDYVRIHLATHAAAGATIDHLVDDPDYLLAADPARLLRALPAAATRTSRLARRAYEHAVGFLRTAAPIEQPAYLEMASRQCGATALAEAIVLRHPDRPWSVRWARCRPVSSHFIAGRHDLPVAAVAIGALSGRPVIISGGGDRSVRVWDLADGTPLGVALTGHHGAVNAVAVGELEGRPVIVSGSSDAKMRVWDLTDGVVIGTAITGHRGRVNAVAIGEISGRQVLVSGGQDRTVRIWDLATGALAGDPLTGHEDQIAALAISELDGCAVVVSASADRTVRIWDVAAGRAWGDPLVGHEGAVNAVAVGELDGRPVAVSAADDRTIRVWDLVHGGPVYHPLTGHEGRIEAVAVGEFKGRPVIVSGSADQTVRIWDLAGGTPIAEPLAGHEGRVEAVAVGELQGRLLIASGSRDRTLRVWDVAEATCLGEPVTGHRGRVNAVAVGELHGQKVVVSGGHDRMVRVWSFADGAPVCDPLVGHEGRVMALAVGELDGRQVVVSAGNDRTVRIWNLADGAARGAPFTGHTDRVNAIAIGDLHGQPVIISGSSDGTVRVWELADGTPHGAPLVGHDGRSVNAVAVGKSGGRAVIVSGGNDRTVRVWDLADGSAACDPLTGHQDRIETVAVSEFEGRPVIVSGSSDGTVRVWDLTDGAPLGVPFTGHHDRVRTVAVGQLCGRPVVVSAGDDQTVRVWDLADRKDHAIATGSVAAVALGSGSVVVGASAGVMLLTFRRIGSGHAF